MSESNKIQSQLTSSKLEPSPSVESSPSSPLLEQSLPPDIEVAFALPTKLEGKFKAAVVCWILGIGSLIAWNSIICIEDYYSDLFPKYHPSRVLTLLYQPFAVGTIAILAYNEAKVDTRMRNLTGYIIFCLGNLFLIVLDLATSGKGGIGPFIGICTVASCLGVADAFIQGGMVGDLSFMCPEFMQSFFAGLAASGTVTSGLRLVCKAVFKNSISGLRKGAMLFLVISTFLEFLCILLYAFVFPKLPAVKYYHSKAACEGSKTVNADLAAAGIKTNEAHDAEEQERLSNKQLLCENIEYAVGLYLIYLLSLSIFPGFLYENTGKHGLGTWYSLVLVAMFNVWDLMSRYIPLVHCLKLESRKALMVVILSRFFLVPAFYFTAKYADQGWMIMLVSFLGLTNGYLTVCIMMTAPKGYKVRGVGSSPVMDVWYYGFLTLCILLVWCFLQGPEQNALGNLLVLFLLGGIFSGVALDWLWIIGNGSF